MSKKAVWLSDIEFIEMHSSDWERLESEAFEPDESVQAQLNENQHVVLDWLKKDYSKNRWTSPFGTIYGAIRQHESQIRILPQEQQAQVLQAFSRWALEEENNG
ncbi:hypothetical protein HRG95_10195 [Enterococcus faecalis]|nr:hypothetical protein [Enterococcus faecalis]